MERFTVSLTNFGIHFPQTFDSFEDAVEFAKSKGFEATIGYEPANGVAGTWSPIGGSCRWDKR